MHNDESINGLLSYYRELEELIKFLSDPIHFKWASAQIILVLSKMQKHVTDEQQSVRKYVEEKCDKIKEKISNNLKNPKLHKSEAKSLKPQLELKIRKQSPVFYNSYSKDTLSPLGWAIGLDRISILYEGLFNLSLIDFKIEKFIPIFHNNGIRPEIQIFKGTRAELINLFDILINRRVVHLSQDGYVQRICKHFTDEKGKNFKPRSLSASKQKISSLSLKNLNELVKRVRQD